MRKIEAIISPYRMEAVREALQNININSFTVSDVHGFGQERSKINISPSQEYELVFIHKLKIEIILEDSMTDNAVEAIIQAARTSPDGAVGDGKIFIEPLIKAVGLNEGKKL